MNDTARALFEAHVKQELASFEEEALRESIAREVTRVFEWLGGVTLNQMATREQIFGVIERYAIEFKIGGGITELAGQMSNTIFSSPQSAETRVDEVLRPESYEEFAAKVVALDEARRQCIRLVAHSSAYGTLVARVLQRGIMDFVFRPRDTHGPLALVADAMRRLPPRFIAAVETQVEKQIGARLAQYIEGNAERIARESEAQLVGILDARFVRTMADDVWEAVAPMRLSEAFAFISAHDLEDFVVLGYEFWLKYRKTRYFRELSREVVGFFFDKYGDESAASLVEDMGVSKEMFIHEIQIFAAPLVEAARETGFLEAQIRARLEPFYASDAVASILDGAKSGKRD